LGRSRYDHYLLNMVSRHDNVKANRHEKSSQGICGGEDRTATRPCRYPGFSP
jgi:hypothetical protein